MGLVSELHFDELMFMLRSAGAGESGKTTIIKQMKILHVQGFSDEERREKALEIRRNIIESIRVCHSIPSIIIDMICNSTSQLECFP